MPKRARVVKWAVPVAAVAVVAAAVGAGPVIAAAQGEPTLPDRTAEQLVAEAVQKWQTGKMPPMSGTVVETASFGLPALPGGHGGADSPISLLAGSHQAKVWYGDPGQIRLMLPGNHMSETDLIVNGDQAWWWDSAANTATRIKVPADRATPSPVPSAITPQEAAERALKAAQGSATISVGNDATVAGRASYEVVLTPKTPDSLVKDVRLALDGETLIPLRVQVYAKGAAEPAFEVGFESITFSKPALENFTFTPPAGAKVKDGSLPGIIGHGRAGDAAGAPADHAALGDKMKDEMAGEHGDSRVIGSGWDSVVVVPFSEKDLATAAGTAPDAKASGTGAPDMKALSDGLLKSATPVSGSWGSGRLIQTKLVSALITDDGRLIAGAVTPEALYKAAGQK